MVSSQISRGKKSHLAILMKKVDSQLCNQIMFLEKKNSHSQFTGKKGFSQIT